MKTLKQLKEAKSAGLEIQEDTLGYIEVSELKKYLQIASKFISDDAKFVINWLIEHNSSYVKDFGGDNPLVTFYNRGIPKDASLKPLYTAIGKLSKANRLLEIPVLQTKEQFDAIISKKESPDEVILDLESDKGRNAVARKFDALVWKIARSFNGKSTFTLDELYSIGLEGLVWAMNGYGKPSTKKTNKLNKLQDKIKDDMDAEEKADIEATIAEIEDGLKKYKAATFLSFASWMIRAAILEAIKNESHLVRIPVSQQNKERAETGRNTKSNSVSGDQQVGQDSEGNGKSLFAYMDDGEKGGKSIDEEDIAKIWKEIYDIVDKKFDKKTMEVFYAANGVRQYEGKPIPKKDLAAKYGTVPSNITAMLFKVKNFMVNDPKIRQLHANLQELMHEARAAEEYSMMEENHHIAEVENIISGEE